MFACNAIIAIRGVLFACDANNLYFFLRLVIWHVRMLSLARFRACKQIKTTRLNVKTMTQQQMTTERNALGLSLLARVQLDSRKQDCADTAAYQPRAGFRQFHRLIAAGFQGHRGTSQNIQGGNP
jgi:hypothetical protein